MKITFYGTRDYDHLYFDVLAADPEYGCDIRFLAANLDKDTAPLAAGGEAVCAFVNADGSAVDVFAKARRGDGLGGGEYIFQPVSPGDHEVEWDRSFGFDLTWYEEEGEPPWS